MKLKNIVVSLVALVALLAIFATQVQALGTFERIEVNGVDALHESVDIAAFAGQTIPVRVTFTADDNASDVRIKVWIAGARENLVSSERFVVDEGKTYSRVVSVQVPFDIDPSEELTLKVSVESKNAGSIPEESITLGAQRESYIVELLDANLPAQITSGDIIPVDIVLKNRGREFAEDTFVRVKITALGVESKAYFGDLSPLDQGGNIPDKEDAVERRLFLSIPSNAKAGVYVVEIEAYNGDSSTTLSKKIAIVGASENSMVVAPISSKTFAVSEKGIYSLTLVNAGSRVRVYEFVVEAPEGLRVDIDEPVVALSAGTSKSVKIDAKATKAGKYEFAVNVFSDGNLVKTSNFVAQVEGRTAAVTAVGGANTTVVLTVVLAIIFVVLLVVLIVLLTRKPEKPKEAGESYY